MGNYSRRDKSSSWQDEKFNPPQEENTYNVLVSKAEHQFLMHLRMLGAGEPVFSFKKFGKSMHALESFKHLGDQAQIRLSSPPQPPTQSE